VEDGCKMNIKERIAYLLEKYTEQGVNCNPLLERQTFLDDHDAAFA